VINKHLRKVEARAAKWAERFTESARFARPPRETLAHALRTAGWVRMPRVEGSLVEADDLIRLVCVDVPELIAEVRARSGRREGEVLASVISYCRFSQEMAGQGVGEAAVGLARGYQDVADKLQEQLDRLEAEADVRPA